MMKEEFEKLAMRNDVEIGPLMYDSIERFYMSDNDYHKTNGGRNETKHDFVKRVFGGKINTPKTIAEKMAAEAIKENRYALRGNESANKQRLNEMDELIKSHYMAILKYKM